MNPREITGVIVTRGNIDLTDILASLPFDEVIVWCNGEFIPKNYPFRPGLTIVLEGDRKVFGRYLAAERARHRVIAVQDDDVIIEDWPAIIEAYEPGVVTCNMGAAHVEYYKPMGLALVGFGAIFNKSLVYPTFMLCAHHMGMDDLFERECDRLFTGLNRLKVISVPYRNLPHGEAPDRMWREKRHLDDLAAIRERIQQVKKKAA